MKDMLPSGQKNSEQSEKIFPLKEAVAQTVKPGMSLHLSTGAYAIGWDGKDDAGR